MRRVVICSPWRGNTALHRRYLADCLRDSYGRGEAPIASHAIGPLCLDEEVAEEREAGIRAGLAWIPQAHVVALYVDLGISDGMLLEANTARSWGIEVKERRLGGEWEMQQWVL